MHPTLAGLPRWLSGKESVICNTGDVGLISWWEDLEKGMVIHSSLLADFLGHRSLVGYSPWVEKESDMTKYQ